MEKRKKLGQIYPVIDVVNCLSQLDPNLLLSRNDVARFLDISLQTLYRRYKEGRIHYVRTKRHIGFPVRVVLEYIEKSLEENSLVAPQ